MSAILIVGGGQAGLQLALGLLQAGHDVTVVSNRTPDDVRDGKVMSSQCMFDAALQHERDLGINFWEEQCPPVEGISLAVPAPPGVETPTGKVIDWASRLDAYAQSVDQRVKMPGWMEELEKRGGRLVIEDAGVDELERYTQENDLVVVAAGKGEIVRLFERDPDRSPYDQPMRALALTYVTGMTPRPEYSAVCFNLIPTVGEYFVFPALTTTGACEIMVFEGIPGGPMDCWGDVTTPAEHLAKSKWILDTFLPWEGERSRDCELTDDNGILAGRFPPTVRKPVAELPSGRLVLGLADAIMLNDPITGQGSNNASKMAAAYLAAIAEHGDAPFDRAFMESAFERFWEGYGQFATTWTNALLSPPPEHVLKLLQAGNESTAIAHRFVNGFDDPRDYFEWFMFPDKADAYLAEVGAA
ncbi:MAG TPA: styrene monooxygenase/indole monooxygenase family protein [Gaiellaceae bacterium]|nr:styrene monooxygenase/indole monooxygenase family protein [Gaiellaceae bacterium]